MSAGQGFARRVTVENLEVFAPLLKRPNTTNTVETRDEDQANTTPPDPAATQAEAEFSGQRLVIRLRYARRVSGGRRARNRTRQRSGAGVAGDFKLMWQSKPLTRRDLTIPVATGTNQTGSINLDKGLLAPNIDHRHYFRDTVFSGLVWARRSATVVSAEASFQLIVTGTNRGTFVLPIRHTTSTTSEGYRQKNAMTRLSWSDARQHITDPDLIGKTLSLYRDASDPTRFQLRIE